MVHYISPAPLTFEVIDKILSKNYKLALSEDSKKLINDCKAYLDHKIESSAKPLYGITTGLAELSIYAKSVFPKKTSANYRPTW